MSTFYAIGNWILGGLRRIIGIQSGSPGSYTEEAASTVTFDSAMQLSGVWACVKLLAETIASLPLNIYRLTDDGRKPYPTHSLSVLFSGKVNQYQTRVEFFESVLLNLVMHGNPYCLIQRPGDRIAGLIPLMSAQMTTALLPDGTLIHSYETERGVDVFAPELIWHLKLFGNGVIGLSPLAHMRNSLGIAQAAETAVTKIYRNGAKPSGVLGIDRILTPAQREMGRANFATLTTSTDDRLMVLEGLYGLVGKASQVIGQIAYGVVVYLFLDTLGNGAYQLALLSLLVTMVIGLWLIRTVSDHWGESEAAAA